MAFWQGSEPTGLRPGFFIAYCIPLCLLASVGFAKSVGIATASLAAQFVLLGSHVLVIYGMGTDTVGGFRGVMPYLVLIFSWMVTIGVIFAWCARCFLSTNKATPVDVRGQASVGSGHSD